MKLDKNLIDRIRSGMASAEEMREAGAENVRAVKADGGAMQFRFETRRAPSSLNAEARTVEHVASNEDVDRMGDRIAVKGWELSAFSRNPVLLWDHNSSLPPIGKVVRARKAKGDAGAELTTISRFHDAETNPQAELVYRMVAGGDLPAVSVGFNPLETVRPKSEEEAKAMGLGDYGVYFKRQELLELSVVTVPAHAGALAKKLDALAEDGEFSYAVINEVMRRLTGEPEPRRVFPVKHPEPCVVEDDLGEIEHDVDLEARAAVAAREFHKLAAGQVDAMLLGTIRAAIREERSADIGVEASARLIRSIVRDEITSAIADIKSNAPAAAPATPPAEGGDGAEPGGGADDPEDGGMAKVMDAFSTALSAALNTK